MKDKDNFVLERKYVSTDTVEIGSTQHIKLTHLPTGIVVEGYTKRSRHLLREDLYAQLTKKVKDAALL